MREFKTLAFLHQAWSRMIGGMESIVDVSDRAPVQVRVEKRIALSVSTKAASSETPK